MTSQAKHETIHTAMVFREKAREQWASVSINSRTLVAQVGFKTVATRRIMTDAEREAARQANIRARENGADDKRKQFALEQAQKARDYALRQDRDSYDDEVVTSWIRASSGGEKLFQYVVTKHGRTYVRELDVDTDWLEAFVPVPRTDARRTYNEVIKADADFADVQLRQR